MGSCCQQKIPGTPMEEKGRRDCLLSGRKPTVSADGWVFSEMRGFGKRERNTQERM